MPDYMNGVWYVSLMTAGVAYIAGRGGVFFIIGGYVSYWFLAPMLCSLFRVPRLGIGWRFGDGASGWHIRIGGDRVTRLPIP